MKRFFKNSVILSLFLIIFSLFFLNIDFCLGQNETTNVSLMSIPEIPLDPFALLWKAIDWFFNFVIIIGIIFIIYAGYIYVTSGGDAGKTKKAMQMLMYALIGIAIALLAKALINFVSEWIGAGKILEKSGGTAQQQSTQQQRRGETYPNPSILGF